VSYQGDPCAPEREAWLALLDGSWSMWHRQTHRVFVWEPGSEWIRVFHEAEHGVLFDLWLLPENRPRVLETVLATITERVAAGYAHG